MKLRNRSVHKNPEPSEEDSSPPHTSLPSSPNPEDARHKPSPTKQPSDVFDHPPPLDGEEEYAPRGGPKATSYRTQKREMDSSLRAAGSFRHCVRIPFFLLVLLLLLLYFLHLNGFM